MKKVLKVLGYVLAGIVAILLIALLVFVIRRKMATRANMKMAGPEASVLQEGAYTYRDLNKNGALDTYEDARAPIAERVTDLVSQMTVEEKAGCLFAHFLSMNANGSLMEIPTLSDPFSLITKSTSETLLKLRMNHVQNMGGRSAREYATWNNNLQKLAERTRLGIPITLISDPRHGTQAFAGASGEAKWISTWPSPLGMGAIGDSSIVREFGDIARQEYRAIGIRLAQHPMADIATEPRWARTNGTFGEDAKLSALLTKAYILGFQGDSITTESVICQTKHFSGGGPQEDGWDAHFASGPGQVYPGDAFDYHLIPFTEGAFPAGTAQIMPYYGVPKGQVEEEVGFAFSKEIIQDLLRDSLGFDGVVATDWGIISDMPVKTASAWGVEHLSERDRMKKVLEAGCDVFGGDYNVGHIIDLVNDREISMDRLDLSVGRVLRDKFRLGLFDDPYVDIEATDIVGNPSFKQKGREAQRRSLVLLKNEDNFLPLPSSKKVFLVGMKDEKLSDKYPQIVKSASEADIIVQKLLPPKSPPRGKDFLERLFPQGRLDYPQKEKQLILDRCAEKPTVTIITVLRPPIMPDIADASKAVIADFECEDDILLELIFGGFSPSGKLPIEFPSSVAAVEAQFEDLPYDSEDPLYPFGHGLTY